MPRLLTFFELTQRCMVAFSDAGGEIWPQDSVEQWLQEAIRQHALNLPAVGTEIIECLDGRHEYDLPERLLAITSVEYPAGLDPPAYLSRKPSTDPSFRLSASYYDHRPSPAGSADILVIGATPATGQSIEVVYESEHDDQLVADIAGLTRTNPCVLTWADHDRVTGDTIEIRGIQASAWLALNGQHTVSVIDNDTFSLSGVDTSGFSQAYNTSDLGKVYGVLTVPPPQYQILLHFVLYCAQRERFMATNQSPESSTLLLSQLAANCDRQWRRYMDLVREAQQKMTDTGPTFVRWGSDTLDRIY